jgi:hypothetical protein
MKKLDDIWGYVIGFAMASGIFFSLGFSHSCSIAPKDAWRDYALIGFGVLSVLATIISSVIAFRKLRR